MTNYMVKSGSGQICFTNPAPAVFPKSKSGTALQGSEYRFIWEMTVKVMYVFIITWHFLCAKCVQILLDIYTLYIMTKYYLDMWILLLTAIVSVYTYIGVI